MQRPDFLLSVYEGSPRAPGRDALAQLCRRERRAVRRPGRGPPWLRASRVSSARGGAEQVRLPLRRRRVRPLDTRLRALREGVRPRAGEGPRDVLVAAAGAGDEGAGEGGGGGGREAGPRPAGGRPAQGRRPRHHQALDQVRRPGGPGGERRPTSRPRRPRSRRRRRTPTSRTRTAGGRPRRRRRPTPTPSRPTRRTPSCSAS